MEYANGLGAAFVNDSVISIAVLHAYFLDCRNHASHVYLGCFFAILERGG